MNTLISVIVPIYNVEKYLNRCVDSVISQTYTNLEICLVNDGSTDNSGRICDEYMKVDSRIKVIHKKNGGLSDARNAALKLISGEYVTFIDSDDFVATDFIEYLYELIIKNNSDISFAGLQSIKEDNSPEKSIEKFYLELTAEDAIKKMLCNRGVSHTACGKLFKSNLWSNNCFPKGVLYEDYAIIYKIFSLANNIVLGDGRKYYYCIRKNSIMTTKLNERQFVLLKISEEVTKFLVNKYQNINVEALRLNVVTNCKVLKRVLDNDFKSYPKIQNQIIKNIKSRGKKLLFSKAVDRKDKVKILSLYLGKYMFYWIYKLGDYKNK